MARKIARGAASMGRTSEGDPMTPLRILLCTLVTAAALALGGTTAAAQPATVSCGTAIDGYFTGTGDWLDVIATRVTARGTFGFSSFTMANGYQVATTPLHTSGAATQSWFSANRGSSHYAGPFHEVFPGRGNGDVDRWDFWVYRSGALWLRSITWGGAWAQLQGVTCYRGPGSQTIITGYSHAPGWSTEFWTFVVVGRTLI
jgi:hypothetical protein